MARSERLIVATNLLAEEFRDYASEQKDLWRSVPDLALEAYGRGGTSQKYLYCAQTGFWTLLGKPSPLLCQRLNVNCKNGELVYQDRTDTTQLADDATVVALAATLDLVDASVVMSLLIAAIEQPYLKSMSKTDVIKLTEQKNGIRRSFPKQFNRTPIVSSSSRMSPVL